MHYDITVSGRVQGVSYRVSARAEALRLGLSGFARNRADGSVELEAEGKPEDLVRFLAWCRRGPPSAVVDEVDVRPGPEKGYSGFRIRP